MRRACLLEHAQELEAQERNECRISIPRKPCARLGEYVVERREIAALWTIHRIGAAIPAVLTAASVADKDPAVRRNAALLAETRRSSQGGSSAAILYGRRR